MEKDSLLKIQVSVFGMVVAILHNCLPPHGCPLLFPQGYHQSFIHELFGLAGHAALVPLSSLRNPASLPKFEEVMHRWHCVMANLPAPPMPLWNKLSGKEGSAWQSKAPKKTPAPKKKKTPTTQLKTAPPSQMPAQQVAHSSSASSSATTLPVIEIGNLRKRKAADNMSHDDEQEPDTCQHVLRPYINKLERDNAKLQEEKNELERQNMRLKKALSQE